MENILTSHPLLAKDNIYMDLSVDELLNDIAEADEEDEFNRMEEQWFDSYYGLCPDDDYL